MKRLNDLAMPLVWLILSVVPLEADKPNFVVFLVDDMGWGDVAAYNSEYHETPNIDSLAREGMKFNQAYAACAVCSPSRAAILTGKHPARSHLTDWIPGHARPKAKLKVPDWTMHIDPQSVTLAEALGEGGYQTQFIGKWHLLPVPEPDKWKDHYPDKHGFDSNIAGREWGQPKGRGKYFYPFDMPNLEGRDGDYLTDALTDSAVEFIRAAEKERPFLLYFSYYTVHGPIIAKPDYKAKYEKKKTHNSFDKIESSESAAYAGMIQSLDESVGRVLNELKAQNRDGNTVILFTSDNGGVLSRANNGPYRDGKATPYEGGIREPLIIKWPGVTVPGSQSDTLVTHTDFYPTFLEIAGLPLRPNEHQDGVSLVPLLAQSGKLQRDTLFWHYPHYHKADPYSAVRKGNLKLIHYFEDNHYELYNLDTDPSETKNLAVLQPELVRELRTVLERWRSDVGAQMMTPNPDYVPNDNWRRPQG